LSVGSSQEDACQKLKNEFLGELHQIQTTLHRLTDHLTAISGYTQLVQFKKECSTNELHKIIHTVEKSMLLLRECFVSLKDLERKYS